MLTHFVLLTQNWENYSYRESLEYHTETCLKQSKIQCCDQEFLLQRGRSSDGIKAGGERPERNLDIAGLTMQVPMTALMIC